MSLTVSGEVRRQGERKERLRTHLKKDVGEGNFESVWEDLIEDRELDDALQDLRGDLNKEHLKWLPERTAYRNLLKRANILAGRYRRNRERYGTYSESHRGEQNTELEDSKRDKGTAEPDRVELFEYEERCARAYSGYLSIQAAKRPDVLKFRAFTLGGTWPTGKETDEELKELAGAALLSSGKALALVRSAEDPGSGLRLRYAAKDEAEIFVVEVLRNSVLDRLRLLSEKLVESFPWHPADAARWLLTGIPVKVSPIRLLRYRHDDVITITALPFVDARTVTDSYS